MTFYFIDVYVHILSIYFIDRDNNKHLLCQLIRKEIQMLPGFFVSTGSMLIYIIDGQCLTGRCDLALSLCVWHHMRNEARRSSACRTLWEQREKKHCTPTHDKPPEINTRRDPCSSSWGWTGGGEPRSRSPWTSSRWCSPYPRWPPATGARGTGKLSSPSVPDRWPSNRRTALDTTARTSTTAGWFSISGRPARISLFWGSSTPASGSPASRTSTLSVRMRLFLSSHRQTARNVSLTFTLSYKHVSSY